MAPFRLRTCWPVAGLAGLMFGCSTRGVVKPRAPDMTELVESYDSPTGVLDGKMAAIWRSSV